MLILSRVCAEFRNPRGETVFRITPANRLTFLEAPEEIRSDPLFRMLIAEGSLEAVESVDRRKQLEQDPTLGTDASGKKLAPEDPEESLVPIERPGSEISATGGPDRPSPRREGAGLPADEVDTEPASAKKPARAKKASE